MKKFEEFLTQETINEDLSTQSREAKVFLVQAAQALEKSSMVFYNEENKNKVLGDECEKVRMEVLKIMSHLK